MLKYSEIELVAEGLDTVAMVTLNDVNLGNVDNMFRRHIWSSKAHLKVG